MYGKGEQVFYNHFKKAWLQAPLNLPYIGDGENWIPTIHVIDLARLVKRIVEIKPEHYYVFAVDRTRKPTQKRIVSAISSGIGTSLTESVDLESVVDEDWAEYFNVNIKMKTSWVMRDLEPPEDAEDQEAAAKALKFPWHCEKGILGNTWLLNDEFNKYRGLNPVKIFLSGPPASGKSFFSQQLSHYYNIPHVNVQSAVDLLSGM